MSEQAPIDFTRFKPRDYQIPFLDELFNKRKKKRFVLIWPRRSGKDLCAFYAACEVMIAKPTQVYFVYPTYSQGKSILWEGLDNEGFPIIEYLPKELVVSKNSSDMTIKLSNGSLLKIVGSQDPGRLVGTNASFIVFSEYALQSPEAWNFLRQVVRGNQGTACFLSTPRGRNHMYDLYNYAKDSEDWFVSKLTLDDTKHITAEELAKERLECSEDLIQQEWFTSFQLGVEGSYYSKNINNLKLLNQIGNLSWQPEHKVHLAADLGYNDCMALVWFQIVGQCVNVIDYYENNKQDLAHYAKIILGKPYAMGKMIFPHDARKHDLGTGLTLIERAHELGLSCVVAPQIGLMAGIEAVRALLPRCWFDEKRTAQLIKCLENYRQEYDAKLQVYKGVPLHDKFSHGADSFRYAAVSMKMLSDNLSAEDLDNLWRSTKGGSQNNVPRPFQQPHNNTNYW
jgi:phage terminase large subunit